MSIFGESQAEKDEFKVIDRLLKNEERMLENESRLLKVVEKLIPHQPPRQKPIFTLSLQIQNQIYIMANVALVIGSPKSGAFTLIDNKTLLPIDGVTYSNQAVGANSNPELATFALDPANPNSVVGTPVAAGTGTVVITTDASYTDPGDGSTQSGSFSVTKTFVVTPSADGATFDVVFP